MKPEARRAEMTRTRISYYGTTDVRKIKRYEAKHVDPLQTAYNEGQEAEWRRRGYWNSYPEGRRHSEYLRGWLDADGMGNHRCSNI